MRHTVLLVDDDAGVRAGLRRALRGEPYDILEAGSAEEALAILGGRAVDVVVSDDEMPGMRGTVFLKKVRERFPDTVRFMLTGKATLENALQAINEGGISRFFLKPCNSWDLSVSIRQGLQQRDLMVAARRLLQCSRRQESHIKRLEQAFPQITRVERDEDGAIVLEEAPGDFEQLAREIFRHLEGE